MYHVSLLPVKWTLLLICIVGNCVPSRAQAPIAAPHYLKLVQPIRESNVTSFSRQFIIGSTQPNSSLLINGEKIKVYPTGAFAFEIRLIPGDTVFTLVSIASTGKSLSKSVRYQYKPLPPAVPVTSFDIERIQTFPEGNLILQAGDEIQFKVKALPGCNLITLHQMPLYELPVTETGGMPGIYQGIYQVKATDSFSHLRLPLTLVNEKGEKITKETKDSFSVLSPLASDVLRTKGRLAHLEYGLGDDRLGGAKIGYIDSLIPLQMIGKVGTHYKVQLTKNRIAYIPDEHVTLMPKGSWAPDVLTGKWRVYGDSIFDYVAIELMGKLPYQSFQLTDPSRIVVDIFGATNNTNWITRLQSAKEISDVQYEQVADGIFRVTIQLRHRQHWGHHIYYAGNTLIIKVKQQPASLQLQQLTIAVDAGHGGSNTGAGGATGVAEKNLTLAISLKLKNLLEAQGATVIMTRNKEQFFDNKERILFYRDSLPDLLLSIHLNSSADPFRSAGTSTFYRYPGFKPLNEAIYKRMLELGLPEYGNNSSFNFMLNSPTEYPNALVEALFLSNLEEEMMVLDESFQQKMAEKIVEGVKDFLKACEK